MYPSFVLAGAARTAARPVGLDREALAWLVGRAAGARTGLRGPGVNLNSLVDPIIDGLVTRLGPTVQDWGLRLATQAEPKMREIAREEIAPKLGMYAAFAMLGAGIFAGVVGAFFASRGRGRAA